MYLNNTEWVFCKMPKHIKQLGEELGLILQEKENDTF